MMKSFHWALAVVFLVVCLNSEVNALARVLHHAHRRPNATHVIPAQVHHSHHQIRYNQTWSSPGGKFNHTHNAPGWQVAQRNTSWAGNPWPTGQRNVSWTNQTHHSWQAPAYPPFHPQQPVGGPSTWTTYPNHTTWSGPAYNQTTWRTVSNNQTYHGWPQGTAQPQQPDLGAPIPINFPIPTNVWAPSPSPSPTFNATSNGTLITSNATNPVPVGNQQFAALSPPNAGAVSSNPNAAPPKPNASSNPYANLFN